MDRKQHTLGPINLAASSARNCMRPLLFAAAMISAATLAGCHGTHSVEWYKTHKAERIAMLKKCESDPGELQHTPNCVNATQADAEVSLGPRDDTSIPSLSGPTRSVGGP